MASKASKEPTEAQRKALALFLLPPAQQMRAWLVLGHDAYEISTDPTKAGKRVQGATFRALLKGGWVEEALPVNGRHCWRISANGRAVLAKPPRSSNPGKRDS
ncbi:MAG TPA: hypothetical protein VHR15_00775 [Ktedonobacterales bacterium]|jgi:hypothetical protein|nr:hypothetical protein [Ktedonobacterales bacterium]